MRCCDVPNDICHARTTCAGCPGEHQLDLACAEYEAGHDEKWAAQHEGPDRKLSNPKDSLGATKLPLALVPATAVAMASVAHLNGALKYGAWNWRKAGVRASIYLDAAQRHLAKWQAGEEEDEEGVPHLASVLACVNILIDARACGKLNDDRPPRVDLAALLATLTPKVEALKRAHADKAPHHWTIADEGVDP